MGQHGYGRIMRLCESEKNDHLCLKQLKSVLVKAKSFVTWYL